MKKSNIINLLSATLITTSCATAKSSHNNLEDSIAAIDKSQHYSQSIEDSVATSSSNNQYSNKSISELLSIAQTSYEQGNFEAARDSYLAAWYNNQGELDNTYLRGILTGLVWTYAALSDLENATNTYELLTGEKVDAEINPNEIIDNKGFGLENHVRANLQASILRAQGDLSTKDDYYVEALEVLRPFLKDPRLTTPMNRRLALSILNDPSVNLPVEYKTEYMKMGIGNTTECH